MSKQKPIVAWEYWLNQMPDHPIVVTRANAADAYPRPLTPLSQDLIVLHEEAATRQFYGRTLKVVRTEDNPDPYMMAFYGLVFLNVDNLASLGSATPGSSRQAFLEQFFGLERDPTFAHRRSWRDRGSEVIAALRVLPRALWLIKDARKRIDVQIHELETLRPRIAPGSDLPLDELAEWFARLRARIVDYWETLILSTGLASGVFEATRQLLARIACDESGDLTNRLHVGIGGSESASMARALSQLTAMARDDDTLRTALLNGCRGAEVVATSERFSETFTGVLRRFGHHAPGELEVATPSWRQRPDQLLDLVAIDLRRDGVQEDRSVHIREEAESILRSRIPAVLSRPVLGLVQQSRRMVGIREDSKGPVVRLFDQVRELLEFAAPQIAASGLPLDPELIYYLREEELADLLGGHGSPPTDELERRRAEHRRCLDLRVPELVEAGPHGLRPAATSYFARDGMLPLRVPEESKTILDGIGASPGVISGRATVLTDPWDDFEPGGIVVTTATDPGWAAVLACAGGVVLDIGGLLSHGAIVARELGIPCVVNVKVASKRITSGSIVTVDGSKGEVRLSTDDALPGETTPPRNRRPPVPFAAD